MAKNIRMIKNEHSNQMEVVVTNAGDKEACGIYRPESKQTWRYGDFYLRRFPLRNEWVIVHQQESTARYTVSTNATSPPQTGWRVCKRGKAPAPRLSYHPVEGNSSTYTISSVPGSIAIVGNGQIVDKGVEIDRADKVVRFNHGVFHDKSASKDIGHKTSTWVFTDMSWRMYKKEAIAFVQDNPHAELICFNPHHPQHTATLHNECPRPFKLLTLNDIRCASCNRFRTWHKTHCCAACACRQGHDAACLTKCPTTGLRYLIHEEGNATLYGFDAFKSGHYGNRFPLRQSSLGHHDVTCEAQIINILQRQRIAPPQVVYAGIYSEKYEGQYNALYTQLTTHGVKQTNIMFKRLPQETFRLRHNCFWCRGKSCHFAFHHGETCKIDFQLMMRLRYE